MISSHLSYSTFLMLSQRDRAWNVLPYPCVGQMRFLDFPLSSMPSYPTILSRLADPDSESSLIDVGCGLGQELRKLVFDGAHGSKNRFGARLVGLDIESQFIDLGYDLFQDRDSFPGRFVAGDLLDDAPTNPISSLAGSADFIFIASFLHLWNWDKQVQACVRLVRLLKDQPGTMVVGRQIGSPEPGEHLFPVDPSILAFSHDGATFTKLWEEVGKQTNTQWNVDASFHDPSARAKTEPTNWRGHDFKLLFFEVTRL